jgi:hypothetical protein
LLAVTAHDNEVSTNLRSRTQDPVEWVACDDHWRGPDSLKLGHRTQLLGQQSFGLAPFDADEFTWPIVIDDVQNMQLCVGQLCH